MKRVDVRVGTGDVFVWPIVAFIWRTVDVERTVERMGLPAESIDDDEILGARGVLVRPPDGPPVVVLEPATEGRLAAALARDDEGESGFYTAPAGGIDEASAFGSTVVAEGRGPFGWSALVSDVGGGPRSRFVIVVAPGAGTIDE
ncbi:MAG TPA: hypothetical protein VFV72_12410 [Candidatus Limnocylindrales bacterium]|nr:hypothetical protein [Candidatus Limnocylindrales bacterium]